MDRRAFLASTLALAGCDRFSLEQGLMSSCGRAGELAAGPAVRQAWQGLRAERVWDMHVHLFGNGRSRAGVWVEPDLDTPQSIEGRVRHAFFMNGGCVGADEERLDQGMVARLTALADECPAGARFLLMAFDFVYDEDGRKREDLSTFAVSNAYARRVAAGHPGRFEWIASVHPYRPDALEELTAAHAGGARAVKWLPPAMGIDLASPRCLPFYDTLARLDLPLITHVGDELAVPGARRAEFANPLHLRVPLDRGVRVVAAHCATLGEGADLDASKNPARAPAAPNFRLFARLMGQREYNGRLFGDISAVTQLNRVSYLPRLMATEAWDGRLLNGSDYPLPGILPLFSLDTIVAQRLLDASVVPALRELRHVNALLFDFVLKRNLRLGTRRFPQGTFETAGFFPPAPPGPEKFGTKPSRPGNSGRPGSSDPHR